MCIRELASNFGIPKLCFMQYSEKDFCDHRHKMGEFRMTLDARLGATEN
jgi:hypothetical protein